MKLNPVEVNYSVYDKELLAIVHACKEWRHFIQGTAQPTVVYTDHKNLEFMTKSKTLNRRQFRWAMFLEDFNLKLVFRPGKKNGLADALSRYDDGDSEGRDQGTAERGRPVFRPANLLGTIDHAPQALETVATQ